MSPLRKLYSNNGSQFLKSLEYFDPRQTGFDDVVQCGAQCSSCGICIAACPQSAISREERPSNGFAYVVNEALCIGYGFCAGVCPCGVWGLVANKELSG